MDKNTVDNGRKLTKEATFYERFIKRFIDIFISSLGIIILSPIIAVFSIIIYHEDPGNVIFKQKRVGLNKSYFYIHKLRSMKQNTGDIPTHMLTKEEQERMILKVGRFIRKTSIDEIPQFVDILTGKMSLVGPRPALWNQEDLVIERDKYKANEVRPGLTGWAQINGRDSISIEEKATLDGVYTDTIRRGNYAGFKMDCRCVFGTIKSVLMSEGVVEGGTGSLNIIKRNHTGGKSQEKLIGHIGFDVPVIVDNRAKKKVLITGKGSYIGQSLINYIKENYSSNFTIDEIDMIGDDWKKFDFSTYDIIYHVAGIAHADVGKVSDETKEKYYAVNTDLALETAQKAKEDGVKEFIFMSSMIVYGESAPYGKTKIIDEKTVPKPANFYGDSKLQADVAVRELADNDFKVIVLRPPMIYGKDCKGNYQTLSKLARKMPVFPNIENARSMLHIDNLCEFLCQVMLIKEIEQNEIVLIPQNPEWTKTSDMVKEIAKADGKKITITKFFKPAIIIGSKIPGKVGDLVDKAFGNNCYSLKISLIEGINYQKVNLMESIQLTEKKSNNYQKSMLMLASVASMIDQFNMSNIELLQSLGYRVDVACNFLEGNTCTDERISELKVRLERMGVDYYQIDFTRNVLNLIQDKKAYNQVKKIVKDKQYSFIHCHSPIGGVVGRLVAHATNTKVIYTAHGFHFFKGAPIKNWMIYYPVEKFLSKWTDILITINQEDYNRAQQKFSAKQTLYVPGIGIDIEKYEKESANIIESRSKLGVEEDEIMILSVGELREIKNHRVVIESLAHIKNDKIKYFIAGQGTLEEELKKMISGLHLENKVILLGFRTDIKVLCKSSDFFIFPSKREGLPVALMEAIACNVPVLASRIRGNTDLINNDEYLFDKSSVDNLSLRIDSMICGYTREELRNRHSNQVMDNHRHLKEFDIGKVKEKMVSIYEDM